MLHSHQLAEKERQFQQELTHEQAVTREKELKGHKLQQELESEQAVSREKESEVQKLQQELTHEQAASREKLTHEQAASREKLTHEQAVSRLAHDDLLTAKMREGESQQLVVKLKKEVSEHKVAIASCIVFMITID